MTSNSALYVGHVTHRRLVPKHHFLRHSVYWLLADLCELPELDRRLRLFSHNRPNLMSLYDRDHAGGLPDSLLNQMRLQLNAAGIGDNDVKISLLCMPRVAGYDFNPLSVYFCRRADGSLAAIIYEVNNTFGGRHSYVIPVETTGPNTDAAGDAGTVRQGCSKEFYVSPFMDLDLDYRFTTKPPAERVSVSIQAVRDGSAVINTALSGKLLPLSDTNILRLTASHPLLPMKVMAAIHWHALKMWMRGFAINPATPSKNIAVSIVRQNKRA